MDLAERQILVEMEGPGNDNYHLHLLHYRIGAGRWITSNVDGEVQLDDLGELQVIPILRNSALPAVGRPFRIPAAYTEAQLRNLRARARQLAEVHGWAPAAAAAPGAPAGAPVGLDGWYYSDTALECFGEEVSPDVLGDPAALVSQGAMGLAQSDLDGKGSTWKSVERVLRSDLSDWVDAKRTGAGRDKRLLRTSKALRGLQGAELLRDIMPQFKDSVAPNKSIFEGPSSLEEILTSVHHSGLEFIAWGNQYLSTSGLAVKSGLAVEFTMHIFTLHYLLCIDGVDARHLAAGEHVARRILQIQRAVKRNPKAPDFDTLGGYTKHLQDSTGRAHAPKFEQFITEGQKTEATFLKQDRLAREEAEAMEKRRKGHPKKEDG